MANVPVASGTTLGVISVSNNGAFGTMVNNGNLRLVKATDARIRAGVYEYQPIVPSIQHQSTFYGLAKAAGDTT